MTTANSRHMREQLGELTERDVEFIIEQLDFCERLARQVNPDYDPTNGPGEMAERLGFLLRRAKRREALHALEVGQCNGVVAAGLRCELPADHEGDHALERDEVEGS